MQLDENILSKDEYAKALKGKRHFKDETVWNAAPASIVIPSGVEESLTISEPEISRDVSTSLDMTEAAASVTSAMPEARPGIPVSCGIRPAGIPSR